MPETVKSITKTIVTDTNAYAAGDFMGTGILTLENAAFVDGAVLHTITVTDLDKQSAIIDFTFWKTVCANTTFTNNAALDIHDTDLLQFAGHAQVSSYCALNDNSVGTLANIGLTMNPASNDKNLYCAPISRGTGTYTASGLQVTFTFIRP